MDAAGCFAKGSFWKGSPTGEEPSKGVKEENEKIKGYTTVRERHKLKTNKVLQEKTHKTIQKLN